MLSVAEAIRTILAEAGTPAQELVSLDACCGRRVAKDISANVTQPPFPASAMDGYAVRLEDVRTVGETLKVTGEAPAGQPFHGMVGAGEAVRIFTGGVVPDGADHVIIQEEVTRTGDDITVALAQESHRHIRPAGVDFKKGDILARTGEVLHEMHPSLLAAANIAKVPVWRRPAVALFSNGDELKEPGTDLAPGEIINSNHYALRALIGRWGGEAHYLGCAPDDEAAITGFFEKAAGADLILPVGGASVGDYDYVKSAFAGAGGETLFQKVAVKPGKPTWYGRLGEAHVIGLPGNPASALVAASLFAQPLIRRLAGDADGGHVFQKARLAGSLPANGARENYLRGMAEGLGSESCQVRPADNQDSSLLLPFAAANVLIRRLPEAPPAAEGDAVEIVPLR